ncbi:DUF1501 domain-containing protein [Marinagarivorans algicola]|uniref:DUF1501 domain-containing protein n=1 Tax=Marinagarivorans algicola TaxID=1513270 RepID=UPI0006B626B7|nr:DUF1501 domain-containing protein [Marinagarivorans algicola]
MCDKKITAFEQQYLTRRHALIKSILGVGSVQLRSLITGVPAALLLGNSHRALADEGDFKYTIFSHLSDGDPLNANAPGTYAENNADPRNYVQHRSDGGGVTGYENGVDFNLGAARVKAAEPWSTLPEDLRSRLGFWHHGTYTNAHSDHRHVIRFHGAIKDQNGAGSAQLAEAMADETYQGLNTILKEPLSVGGSSITYRGRAIPVLRPSAIKELFASSAANLDEMVALRDHFIDSTYKKMKREGTPAQLKFLDRYALSRVDAQEIATNLGSLITDIEEDNPSDQVKMAVALLQLGIAPTVTLGIRFGGDNHGSIDNEVEQTGYAMKDLTIMWDKLKAANLQDKVVFASLNVFGRTLRYNTNGGRNHNGMHHTMLVAGSSIKPGVVGGIEPTKPTGTPVEFKATGINSNNRTSNNPDIAYRDTLVSAGKTLAKAAGLSNERINIRFNGGKIITGALS